MSVSIYTMAAAEGIAVAADEGRAGIRITGRAQPPPTAPYGITHIIAVFQNIFLHLLQLHMPLGLHTRGYPVHNSK